MDKAVNNKVKEFDKLNYNLLYMIECSAHRIVLAAMSTVTTLKHQNFSIQGSRDVIKVYRDDFAFAITALSIVSSFLHLFRDADKLLDFLEKKREAQEEQDMQYTALVNVNDECTENCPPHYRRCEAFTINQHHEECQQICERIEDKAYDILDFFK